MNYGGRSGDLHSNFYLSVVSHADRPARVSTSGDAYQGDTKMKSEIRSIRAKVSDDGGRLIGHAAVFNSPSHVLSERGKRFVEKIKPGAFARSLKEHPDVTAHWSHNEDLRPPLGRTTAGTLVLSEDADGLKFELDLPAWANDVREAVQRGDVSGVSFKFSDWKDSWESKDNMMQRTLHEVRLHHIAIVTTPAYPDTSVEARSMAEPPHNLDTAKAKLRLREIETK